MVLINKPNELEGGNAPLHLDDLQWSELTEMAKVCMTSSNTVRFLVFTQLSDLQLETSKLRAELRTVSSAHAVPMTTEQLANPLDKHQASFSELRKKFCILAELWVNESALGQPYPTTVKHISPWSPDCYNSTTSKQDGVTAEIYAYVPKEFHKLLHISPLFSSTVRTATSLVLHCVSSYPIQVS